MKEKPASINFYPDDFLGGTFTMSLEERGAYITLLSLQSGGNLSLEDIKAVIGDAFGRVWPRISKKFTKDSDGKFYNQRWRMEMENRMSYMLKMRENGKKGGRPKKEENQQVFENETNRLAGAALAKPNLNNGLDNNIASTNVEESIIINRGVRGEDIHACIDQISVQLFQDTYGKAGKRGSIEQELKDAIRSMQAEGFRGTNQEAFNFILSRAQAFSAHHRILKTQPKYINAPENWLAEKMYLTDWLKQSHEPPKKDVEVRSFDLFPPKNEEK